MYCNMYMCINPGDLHLSLLSAKLLCGIIYHPFQGKGVEEQGNGRSQVEGCKLKNYFFRTSSPAYSHYTPQLLSTLPPTHTLTHTHTPVELEPGDKATECHCLMVPRPSSSLHQPVESQLSLGTYTIRWKRATSAHPHSLISTVSFPPIMAKLRPFTVVAG